MICDVNSCIYDNRLIFTNIKYFFLGEGSGMDDYFSGMNITFDVWKTHCIIYFLVECLLTYLYTKIEI